MRTNIVLDDEIMKTALKLFIQIKGQQKIKNLKGKIKWEGNLEEMRRD